MLGAGFKPVGELCSQPFDSAFVAVWGVRGAEPVCMWCVADVMHKTLLCAKPSMSALVTVSQQTQQV